MNRILSHCYSTYSIISPDLRIFTTKSIIITLTYNRNRDGKVYHWGENTPYAL